MAYIQQNFPMSDYLERLGFEGSVRTDLETLSGLHRAHTNAVPFENVDIQLGRPVTLDLQASLEKIVRRRRGGWCYELNGVFGWALQEIGFDVSRVSAGVMREHRGDAQMGGHLCLLVRLDEPYLVDVGFGGSQSQPLPLRPSQKADAPYRLALAELGGGYWRYTEQAIGEPFSFDFFVGAADEARFAEKCRALQTDADSPFVQNLVVQRRNREEHLFLHGKVFTVLRSSGEEKSELRSPDELVGTLRETFGLDLPEAAALWPAICARHDQLFG